MHILSLSGGLMLVNFVENGLGGFLRIIYSQVWSAVKFYNDSDQPNHEIDVLAGHENDVNYVQFWLVVSC